ncbi:PKD domain-containing protein [Algoriphagus sediminis]|uniref:PKD domain-containing protein n=1 Tax=Algoriphagus sediminis TaxID=3057113 RepID=A0ABT7YDL9_9BACT|nr:PKD domain-containing protein [Algoriphagus sediminis]MDN3204625.1 PKD domain-containing protein [Algoriphagus sediminis]
MRKLLLAFLFTFLISSLQNIAFGQLSTVGKEFWVGFMDNNRILPDAPDQAVIVISANEDASGTIEYLGRTIDFDLQQGQQFTHVVPSTEVDLLHRVSGLRENKGVYILSNGKVAVYAFNERFRSADGTVVLPIGALGKDYRITSHYEVLTGVNYNGNINDESQLLVIATEDNTNVEITPTVNTLSGGTANVPFTISLDRGQSYQLKSKSDMTGTRVRVVGDNADDCKRIAVFGGNKWTSVGQCGAANDNLFQQAYPVNTWGTSFVHVALSGRTSGELVKVLAAEDGTEVFVDGTSRGTINAGEFLSLEFGINQSAGIETSKPSSVTMFAKSQECNQPNAPNYENGDPFMISYSPNEQLLKSIRFNALDLPSIVTHYVNVVVSTAAAPQTILDGQNVGGRFSPLLSDPSLSYARMNISQGVHQLSNPEGFTAYVYGFGFLESYGFAVGAALDNLNFETEAAYEFEVDGINVACLNEEAEWSIVSENPDYTYFVWDFGDGSDPVVGQTVTHIYSEPGTYPVSVSAALSPNTCEEQENIDFEIEVNELSAELFGESSVCPDIEEVIYKIGEKENIGLVEFEVEGGTILENYGDSILVAWGPANPNARVIAKPFAENGCPGDEIILDVLINNQLQASLPEGPLDICFDPAVSHFYQVSNPVGGRFYDWEIEGGEILSGNGTSEIEAIWNNPGITGRIRYTVSSLVDESCEGVSDFIDINVTEEFIATVSNDPLLLCNGDSNGTIEIDVQGGVEPYSFEWEHDGSLDSGTAENLSAGFYTVKVIDAIGCERLISDIEVIEPEAMAIASIAFEGTSCFGKADGTLDLQITGGVAPYSIDFRDGINSSGSVNFTDLEMGVYNWDVVDANGCIILVEFEITSPAPLEVDVRLERPACPGGFNGELIAIPTGGNGPYVYSWDEGSSGANLIGLGRGQYEVSVLDSDGCVSLGRGRVVERAPQIRMPTGFDPKNNAPLYQGVSNCEVIFQIWIYDRWGQLIYTGNEGWDGQINGNDAPTGTYSYMVSYSYTIEEVPQTQQKRGTFTLIR